MRISADIYSIQTALFSECSKAEPRYRLSSRLKKSIEEFPRQERKDVVSKMIDGCAPLFLACKKGSAEVADYLLTKCNAPIEQKGLFEVLDEGVSHSVTPLWCAAVSGRLAVVKVLLRHGADVNAVSDSGSTPVRSACYIVRPGENTGHMEIIKALVEAGADIQMPNHFGGTCLINSVQSPYLVEYLIKHGADVNAEDVQHKTALHYAVQEHRLDTTKVLLQHGADPMKKSKYGDDILQTACIKGAIHIFNFILEMGKFSRERVCDAFELMGASFLLDAHDMGSCLFFWHKGLEFRSDNDEEEGPVAKPRLGQHAVLGIEEFQSASELETLSFDIRQMKLQALLITERVLGSHHKDTIFRFMYAGAAHADATEYRPCIHLWNYALGLKIEKETLLSSDTSFTVRAVIQLFLNILIRDQNQKAELQFSDVVTTTKYVTAGLKQAQGLIEAIDDEGEEESTGERGDINRSPSSSAGKAGQVRPQFQTQLDNYDLVLQSWLHLLYLLLRLATDFQQRSEIFVLVKHFKRLSPRAQNGDSILHLAVAATSAVRSNSFLDDESISLFPSAQVVEFLLHCGFSTSCRNNEAKTPLHTAALKANFSLQVAELLLGAGAHLDARDASGCTPASILATHPCKLDLVPYTSLKCLASQAIRRHGLPVSPPWLPQECRDFYAHHL